MAAACHQSYLPADLADMGGLGTLEGGVPVEVRTRGRARIHFGADGTPDPGDAAAEIARGQILVRVQLPGEGPRS
jgi:hypothetical protein